MKQKQQKGILGHGMAQPCEIWHGPCQASDLGMLYFCAESRIFQPESAPNPLSFAPRLNLSNIRS